MIAPPTIIDQLIVHKLDHLRHDKHDAAFWNEGGATVGIGGADLPVTALHALPRVVGWLAPGTPWRRKSDGDYERHPSAIKVRLVMDNLKTHSIASLSVANG